MKQKLPFAELSNDGCILLADHRLWLNPATVKDKPFIISTWVNSYKPIARKLTARFKEKKANFTDDTTSVAEKLWQVAYVLKDEDDGSAVHGYIVAQDDPKPILHYMYLPPELRGLRLGKCMFQRVFGTGLFDVQVTHFWPHNWPYKWHFNPYAVRYV